MNKSNQWKAPLAYSNSVKCFPVWTVLRTRHLGLALLISICTCGVWSVLPQSKDLCEKAVVRHNVLLNGQTIADVCELVFGKTDLNCAECTVNILSAQRLQEWRSLCWVIYAKRFTQRTSKEKEPVWLLEVEHSCRPNMPHPSLCNV